MVFRTANPDATQELLKARGFHLEQLDDSDGELEALYIKERPSGASIYVTVPINCDSINEDALVQIMKTANIPQSDYSYLLS